MTVNNRNVSPYLELAEQMTTDPYQRQKIPLGSVDFSDVPIVHKFAG